LCHFDVNTDTVLAAITRRDEVDWRRVKRLSDRYPDDAGLGTAIRTFIWATAKAVRDGNGQLRKLAKQTRRLQTFMCARAEPSAVERFKREFPAKF
jgi:hypothetical protein